MGETDIRVRRKPRQRVRNREKIGSEKQRQTKNVIAKQK